MSQHAPATCLRCQADRRIQARGLCNNCYKIPGVKDQYARSVHYRECLTAVAPQDDPEPTDAPPGSPERIDVLAARVLAQQRLWNAFDATGDGDDELDRDGELRRRAEIDAALALEKQTDSVRQWTLAELVEDAFDDLD